MREVFHVEGANVILSQVRPPKANAFAERWMRTVRAELLDGTLVPGRRHLDRVLNIYVEHFRRTGRMNLRGTADALKGCLERG
jgi:putative transposase